MESEPIKSSSIFCAACKKEIDLWDGPVRMIGKPKQFPFCWMCWRELLKLCVGHKVLVKEISDKEMHIWLDVMPNITKL